MEIAFTCSPGSRPADACRSVASARRLSIVAGILCLTLAACGSSTEPPSAPTDPGEVVLEDNLMAFVQAPPPTWLTDPPPQPSLSLGLEYGDAFAISAGQPWQGVQTTGGTPGTVLEVTVKAGRHDTAPPAEWFNERADLLLDYAVIDDTPSELNFAFAANLVINGSSYPIYLGQGSDLAGDDWWLGTPFIVDGPSWTKDEKGYLHTPDGQYVLCPKDGGYFGAHGNAFQVITPELTVNCEEA
jgi:hypothetical protein